MEALDDVTWQVLTVTLTLLGLVLSVLLWRSRGAASGLRGVAWSLLPVAAYLTGTLRLLWEIADAVVDWAVRLVLSPMVWLGIAVAGVSVLLFVVSGLLRRRRPDAPRRRDRPRGSARSDVSLPGAASRKPAEPTGGPAGSDDLDDIEAILKKHGIS